MNLTTDHLRGAMIDLARSRFYFYCRFRLPRVYTKDRPHLERLCDALQSFWESDNKRLILNMPPRMGKTLTVELLTEWILGEFNGLGVFVCCYNETLSSRFSKAVRGGITEIGNPSGRPVFSDYFPGVSIKQGDAAMQLWALEGSHFSFLATSPGGTATGIGAQLLIVDDLIKNAEEANNERILDEHWEWYCFTGDTPVLTPHGETTISDIGNGSTVLTYNHSKCSIEEGIVSRSASKESEVYRLRFENGSEIRCSGNHRLYTNNGYVSVEEALHCLRVSIAPGETVLLPLLQIEVGWKAVGNGKVYELRKRHKDGTSEQAETILFYGLSNGIQEKDCGPEEANVEQGQRNGSLKVQDVSGMRIGTEARGSSHRSQSEKQRSPESEGYVPLVPFRLSQVTREKEKVTVFDIEVEGNHNFFANGVLAHNCNTILSRLESGAKQIVIQTRWATKDLTGRLLAFEPDKWDVIKMPAMAEDGTMLCESILSKEEYLDREKKTDPVIFLGNYQQEPYDSVDKLYPDFKTYQPEELPSIGQIEAYVDTADEGMDYLAGAVYRLHKGVAYILDAIHTQDPMDKTEPLLARMLADFKCNDAFIESNNGGRGFARNVERLLMENHKFGGCRVTWFHQGANKEARILTNCVTAVNSIRWPVGWENRWPSLAQSLRSMSRGAKWKHDDAADMVTGIVEKSIEGKGRVSVPTTNVRARARI